MKTMIEAAPFRIQKCLNDNGSKFTDHFLVKAPQPMGIHPFDQAGAEHTPRTLLDSTPSAANQRQASRPALFHKQGVTISRNLTCNLTPGPFATEERGGWLEGLGNVLQVVERHVDFKSWSWFPGDTSPQRKGN
ncbi:hypothetical protein [Methylococcus capsulatus]|uniref:hypothetical protein n=1 Tax=Methylococcus capsulatus TaxID=414 RepID=UPI001C52C446|nr:hypothetical protein [Methylococcus capsulatus]QXP90588.1 hypothetical protein KW114_16495 [Methylococcus capsulatus]